MMSGGVRMRGDGKKIEEDMKNGGVMRRGAERPICAVGHKSVAAVKSVGWRKIGDVLKPCASRRELLGRERWQRDNTRKIKCR
jgi:hypothetical protein